MPDRAPRKRRDCVKMDPQPRAPADPGAVDRALEEARLQGAREQSRADQETEIEVKHG